MYWFQIIAQAESLGHFFLLAASTNVPLEAFCSNSMAALLQERRKDGRTCCSQKVIPPNSPEPASDRAAPSPWWDMLLCGTPTAIPLKGVLKITTAVAPAHQAGRITISQAFPLSQQWLHSAACNRALKVIEKVCCTTSALAPVPTRTLVRALGLFYKG